MYVTFKILMASTPGNDKVLLKHVGCMKSTINTTGDSNWMVCYYKHDKDKHLILCPRFNAWNFEKVC